MTTTTLSARDKQLLEACAGIIEQKFNELPGYAKHATPHATDLDTFVSRMPNTSVPGTVRDEEGEFFISRYAKALADPDAEGCEVERDAMRRSDGIKSKALTLGTPTAGGHVVPEEQARTVIELLRAKSVVFQAGARSLTPKHSPYLIPRMDTSGAATWIGEGVSINESDSSFDQVSMSVKKLGRILKYSSELVATADPSIEEIMRDDLAKTLQLGLDLAALTGSGSGANPTGVSNQTGILTQAVSATPTYEELQGFVSKVRNADALMGSLAWVMAPESWAAMESMKDEIEEVTVGSTTGLVSRQPLLRRSLTDAIPDRLLGYPVFTTSQLPATVGAADTIFFGDWSQLLIGRWSTGLRLERSLHANFSTDEIALRALLMADIAVRHPESFCVAT